MALGLCIAPSITKGLLGKLMNKREGGSMLRDNGLTVICLKNVLNSICDLM